MSISFYKTNIIHVAPIFFFILSFYTTVYAVGGPGIVDTDTSQLNRLDIDNDGIIDSLDLFPYNYHEWKDSDNDGTGNNSDPDDDNDGMSDTWEVKYNLDPFFNDAAGDKDKDDITNFSEFKSNTDPTLPESDPEVSASNSAPYAPVLSMPNDESTNTPLMTEFLVGGFDDPDQGDLHAVTEWQIGADSDFSSLVLERSSTTSLVSTTAPIGLFEAGTEYFWRVRFYDNHGAASQWSEAFSFVTGVDYFSDNNADGVPDDQEVDDNVDMDQDNTPDTYQGDILSLTNTDTDIQLGIKGFVNVIEVESAMIVDSDTVPGFGDAHGEMLFGFVSMRILVEEPGDVATVKVYLSQPAPTGAHWYKFDPFNGFYDYSDYAIFSPGRRNIVLELKDGGYGDTDGIENGVIVDPGGLFIALTNKDDEDDADNNVTIGIASSMDESQGCFISSSISSLYE